MKTKNNEGIDALKRLVRFLATAVYSIADIDQNRDGEVSNTEKIGLVTGLLPGALSTAGDFAQIKAESARGELTSEEINELVEYAVSLPMLPNDKERAAIFVRKAILWANYNRVFASFAIDFFKKDEIAPIAA